MRASKKIIQFTASLLPLIFVFLSSIYRPFDPDLGWHLKYGQYFFQNWDILRENIFATDMPNYHWVNLSWGIDLLYYLLYHLGGFLGLSIASAIVVTLTFWFFAKAFQLDFFEKALIFPLIVFLIQPVISVSFRGQLVSILFLGILTYLMLTFERTRSKIIYLIPPLFLLWANLHGQFAIGLGIYGLWAFSLIVKEYIGANRAISKVLPLAKKLSLTFILSIGLTLLNPFGIGIYEETARYFRNPLLKDVTEYVAPEELSRVWWNHIIVGVLTLIGGGMLYFRDRLKGVFSVSGIFAVLYILSFVIRRYSWSMYYFIIPFIKPVAAFLKPDSKNAQFYASTFIFLIVIGITFFLKSPWSQYREMSWDSYCKDFQDCSPRAAEYLRTIKDRGNLMNLYAWGGWLIWQYPDIKPSIDGRMHLWRDEKGKSAFEEYYQYEQNLKDVDTSTYDTVFMSKYKPVYNRLLQLAREGKWKLVYQDNTSAIFTRVK